MIQKRLSHESFAFWLQTGWFLPETQAYCFPGKASEKEADLRLVNLKWRV